MTTTHKSITALKDLQYNNNTGYIALICRQYYKTTRGREHSKSTTDLTSGMRNIGGRRMRGEEEQGEK